MEGGSIDFIFRIPSNFDIERFNKSFWNNYLFKEHSIQIIRDSFMHIKHQSLDK